MFEEPYKAESYIVEAEGPDDEAAHLGVGWLIDYAKKHGGSTAGIFVATLKQVDSFARFLGSARADALRKRRQISIENVTVKLLIERDLPYEFDGPILCMWVDDERLEEIEALRAPAICAIPWIPKNLTNWKLARTPRDLRTGALASEGPNATPVLAAALRDLTTTVNVSTGIIHPSDKSAAIDLFRTLKSANEPFSAQDVRALANRLGWKGEHARELGELADKILAGRQVRGREPGGERWGSSSLDRWRSASAQADAE